MTALLQKGAELLGAPTVTDVLSRDVTPRNRAERRATSVAAKRRLRSLWRAAGYSDVTDQIHEALVDRMVPGLAGGATGQGGVAFVSNLPADKFQMNPALFEQSTERQDIPQQQQTFNGFGSNTQIRLQNVGVMALIRVYVTGTLTVAGTGAVTALPGFPYGLIKRIAFTANGQTQLLSASAIAYRARRNRLFRNPAESIETAPAVGVVANGSYPVAFMVDIPISHDMLTGMGWVLGQNPSSGLTCDIAWANQADAFTVAAGGTVALAATVYPTLTTFAVGQDSQGTTIVPDLTVFHGFIEGETPFNASGQVQAPLIRTAGQLLNYAFHLDNNGVSEISPASLTEIQFRYGGNRQPRVYNPPQHLIEKNQADYNGLVAPRGRTWTFLDFEVDNPVRDLFIPQALVELLAQVTIPNSVTVNNGARLRYLEETLYPAV